MEPLTLGSAWWSASGVEVDDRLIEWPADVFALTEVVLEQSEAYRFVLSPPAGAAVAAGGHGRLAADDTRCRGRVDGVGPRPRRCGARAGAHGVGGRP